MDGEHAKPDDDDKYKGNGHDPDRGIPPEDPGGKHGKSDKDDKDKNKE